MQAAVAFGAAIEVAADGEGGDGLDDDFEAPADAVAAVAGDFGVVIEEAEEGGDAGDEQAALHGGAAEVAEEEGADDDEADEHEAAHGGRAGLFLVLGCVAALAGLADGLAGFKGSQDGDEARADEDRGDEGQQAAEDKGQQGMLGVADLVKHGGRRRRGEEKRTKERETDEGSEWRRPERAEAGGEVGGLWGLWRLWRLWRLSEREAAGLRV